MFARMATAKAVRVTGNSRVSPGTRGPDHGHEHQQPDHNNGLALLANHADHANLKHNSSQQVAHYTQPARKNTDHVVGSGCCSCILARLGVVHAV
eukprot:m.424415 g.424415  ORF g.424415 m.424415 type:complete len:95 (-) comp20212_c1_seq35:220-504(-)